MTRASDPGQRPSYPLSQAAKMTGLSLSTIKRKRAAGAFPNATQDGHGAWVVPVEDLLAAGLHLNRPEVVNTKLTQVSDPGQEVLAQVSDPGQLAAAQRRIAELEAQLRDANAAKLMEQVKRESAETIAHERERRAETAEKALLMLEAANPRRSTEAVPQVVTQASDLGQPEVTQVSEPPRRRRWWRRH